MEASNIRGRESVGRVLPGFAQWDGSVYSCPLFFPLLGRRLSILEIEIQSFLLFPNWMISFLKTVFPTMKTFVPRLRIPIKNKTDAWYKRFNLIDRGMLRMIFGLHSWASVPRSGVMLTCACHLQVDRSSIKAVGRDGDLGCADSLKLQMVTVRIPSWFCSLRNRVPRDVTHKPNSYKFCSFLFIIYELWQRAVEKKGWERAIVSYKQGSKSLASVPDQGLYC